MRIFDSTLGQLERSLDVRLVRQNVLASNVANLDTPGFRPKDVDFATAMATIDGAPGGTAAVGMSATASDHLDGQGGVLGSAADGGLPAKDLPIVDVPSANGSLDGNTVDLDRTMVAMAENALQYGATARAAGRKLAILKYVASDGGA
jgi:flagellar basal-body rod protein FlgB